MVCERLARSPVEADSCITPLDGVKAGGEDQGIQFVEFTIGRCDSRGIDMVNRGILKVDNIDIGAIELLVVAAIAERPSSIWLRRHQFPGLFWVCDDLGDFRFDEFTGGVVGLFVAGDVGISTKHESEPVSLIPETLEDLFTLFRGDRGVRCGRLGESKASRAFREAINDFVIMFIQPLTILGLDRSVATGDTVLGISLKAHERLDLGCELRDDLHSCGSVTQNTNALVGQIYIISPAGSMTQFSFEIINPFIFGKFAVESSPSAVIKYRATKTSFVLVVTRQTFC